MMSNQAEIQSTGETISTTEEKGKGTPPAFASIISGRFLTSESTMSNIPYLIFITILGIVYIGMGNYSENREKEQVLLTEQIRETRSQYRVVADNLMYVSREKEVAKACAPAGIKELVVPPQRIVINNNRK